MSRHALRAIPLPVFGMPATPPTRAVPPSSLYMVVRRKNRQPKSEQELIVVFARSEREASGDAKYDAGKKQQYKILSVSLVLAGDDPKLGSALRSLHALVDHHGMDQLLSHVFKVAMGIGQKRLVR